MEGQFPGHGTYAVTQDPILWRIPCLVLCSADIVLKCLISERGAGAPHFHFALGPAILCSCTESTLYLQLLAEYWCSVGVLFPNPSSLRLSSEQHTNLQHRFILTLLRARKRVSSWGHGGKPRKAAGSSKGTAQKEAVPAGKCAHLTTCLRQQWQHLTHLYFQFEKKTSPWDPILQVLLYYRN